MILLGYELPSRARLFYRESIDDSNILRTPIDFYKAWSKPEKANEWREKLEQIEDFEE
jgi:hypothetical protein